MMERILARAEAIGHAAQRDRIEQIANGLRSHGIAPTVDADNVSWLGRGIVKQWLLDPLLRFIGRGA